jgi:hypothetical protein
MTRLTAGPPANLLLVIDPAVGDPDDAAVAAAA